MNVFGNLDKIKYSQHANTRMFERSIGKSNIKAVLLHGKENHDKGTGNHVYSFNDLYVVYNKLENIIVTTYYDR